MAGNHALYAPSGLGCLVKCPGSWLMQAMFPEDEESEAAREGTAAHWLAEQILIGREWVELSGSLAPNGILIDEEMCEAVELYVGVCMDHARYGQLDIEKPVTATRIHPQCWGTPDAAVVDWANKHLYVDDFKYGHGYVEVLDNMQLVAYVAGKLDEMKIDCLVEQEWRVTMTIVQPRCYGAGVGPVRSWTVAATDLRQHYNLIRAAIEESATPSPICRPGPHCTHCTGRRGCGTLQHSAEAAADLAKAALPLELPPAALGTELRYLQRALKLLQARVSGLEEQALSVIRGGTRVPHFTITQGEGRERWVVSDAEVVELGKAMGANLAKPLKAITPNQARKLIDETVISAYSEKPRGELKLAPENTLAARRIFGS